MEEGVDIALRVRPVIEDSATLVAKNFGESRGMLVASPELLRKQGPVRTPFDLERLDTVAMSAAGDGRASMRLEGPAGAEHMWHHAPRYLADDLATLQFAVVGGTGAGILPVYMCLPDIRNGRLKEVLPGWGPKPGICHAVFPQRRALVPAVRKLIDFLAENMSGAEPLDYSI